MSKDFELFDLFEKDKKLSEKLDELVENGNEKAESSHFEEAIEIYLEAWEILPKPKQKWSLYSAWISGSLFNAFFDIKDYKNSKKWALMAAESRSSEISMSELIYVGMACFELNQIDEAMTWFDKAYLIGKDRAFKEFDKKYLKEYKSYCKNKAE